MYTALSAYQKGDYSQAFQDYLALAKLGQPLAQLNVARLYMIGRGVHRSDILAYAWASLAAENGEASGRKMTAVLGPALAPGSKHENPTATEIRAAAQAAEGDFAGAVQSERKAIGDAGKLGWDLSPLEQRLALYQARKPWHGNLLAFGEALSPARPRSSAG